MSWVKTDTALVNLDEAESVRLLNDSGKYRIVVDFSPERQVILREGTDRETARSVLKSLSATVGAKGFVSR
jgi:hypothetical protein